MAFTINKNLVFIDSMQFMNSSPDSLVKNSKKKECILMSIWTVLKSFLKISCMINLDFLVL